LKEISHENLTMVNVPGQEIEGIFNPFVGWVLSEQLDTFPEENIQSKVAVVQTPVFDG